MSIVIETPAEFYIVRDRHGLLSIATVNPGEQPRLTKVSGPYTDRDNAEWHLLYERDEPVYAAIQQERSFNGRRY